MTTKSARPRTTRADGMVAVPFTIVVDSREKAPFGFRGILGTARQGHRVLVVPWEFDTLTTGDYSIRGYESAVAVERKSHTDLISSLGKARDRFRREMERLAEMTYAAVVVECSLSDLVRKAPEWSRMCPRSVVATMIAWSLDFTVPFWLADTRRQAEVLTFRYLEKAYARLHTTAD